MKNFINSNKNKNVVMVTAIVVMAAALVSGSVIATAFAQPPTQGYKTSGDCSSKVSGGKATQTCCYRTSTGTGLGETYCQTCTLNADAQPTDCDQPELQFRSTSGSVPDDNDNDGGGGGVFKDPGVSNKGTNEKIPMQGEVLTSQP